MSDWIVIRAYSSRNEAEIVRSLLESCGIKAKVNADDAAGLRPNLAFTLGAQLLVQTWRAAEADAVLNAEVVPGEPPD